MQSRDSPEGASEHSGRGFRILLVAKAWSMIRLAQPIGFAEFYVTAFGYLWYPSLLASAFLNQTPVADALIG